MKHGSGNMDFSNQLLNQVTQLEPPKWRMSQKSPLKRSRIKLSNGSRRTWKTSFLDSMVMFYRSRSSTSLPPFRHDVLRRWRPFLSGVRNVKNCEGGGVHPKQSMGLIYLPITCTISKKNIHVGKYTCPMDDMENGMFKAS